MFQTFFSCQWLKPTTVYCFSLFYEFVGQFFCCFAWDHSQIYVHSDQQKWLSFSFHVVFHFGLLHAMVVLGFQKNESRSFKDSGIYRISLLPYSIDQRKQVSQDQLRCEEQGIFHLQEGAPKHFGQVFQSTIWLVIQERIVRIFGAGNNEHNWVLSLSCQLSQLFLKWSAQESSRMCVCFCNCIPKSIHIILVGQIASSLISLSLKCEQ